MAFPNAGLHERLASDQRTDCCSDACGQTPSEGETASGTNILAACASKLVPDLRRSHGRTLRDRLALNANWSRVFRAWYPFQPRVCFLHRTSSEQERLSDVASDRWRKAMRFGHPVQLALGFGDRVAAVS
jgi:hypothetical protein